ncbi:MAG TPA: CPBP family intramembrane glutamic endopeptidase [Tepidisphaeraceae bacterium]|nr:CPBP family intramembrane glutamic endopeptidase [Tepidisphaeraceae bacterium]
MSRAAAVGNASAAPRRASAPAASTSAPNGYFEQSALPLASLVFLAPLIVLYELGTRWYASDPVSHVEQRIIAFSLMQQFFSLFGATGKYLPAAAVVAILLAWHIARNDAWTTHIGHLVGMFFESAVYAIPLRALAMAFAHYLPLYSPPDKSRALLVLSVGAGIYEEMVFRLIAFTVMSVLFIDVLKMEKIRAFLLMVLVSSLAFSAYHYLGSEAFEWRSFAFRTLAGIYFGIIFVWRGFGITAGAHAFYDISTFALRMAAHV